jgi:peptidoglycan-associated lipoprotein
MPPPDTATVAAAPKQDSLAAANRARTDSLEQARLAALARTNRARTDSIERVSAALRVELAGLIHFDFDQAVIQPVDRAALNRKAAILSANPAVRVRIAGSCDDRGSDEYNLALGSRRAAAAKRYLIEQGIDADRLDVMSLGSASPLDPNQNEAAWAMNRRAGLEITSGGNALTTPVALR